MRAARVRGSVVGVTVTETGTRAREADERGYATTDDGLRLYWERYGSGSPTIVLLPPCPISHSRLWKAQVHYLARHHRVVVYDGRGNGNSDCPDVSGPWIDRWRASDCLAVMDATATATAVLGGICGDGVQPSLQIAAEHPERVLGIVAIAPGVPALAPPHPWRERRARAPGRGAGRADGMGEGEPPLHARPSPGVPRVLLRRDVPGATLDQAGRGRRRLRARRLGRGAADGRHRPRVCDEGGGRSAVPARALPGARRPGRPRQLPARRARAPGRRAHRAESASSSPARATSRWPATRWSSTG